MRASAHTPSNSPFFTSRKRLSYKGPAPSPPPGSLVTHQALLEKLGWKLSYVSTPRKALASPTLGSSPVTQDWRLRVP
jgi:hypothetical protein